MVSLNICEMEHHPHDDAPLSFDCEMPPPTHTAVNQLMCLNTWFSAVCYWAFGKVVESLRGGVLLEKVGHCDGSEVLKPGSTSCSLSVP